MSTDLQKVLAAQWNFLRQGVEVQSCARDDFGDLIDGQHEISATVNGVPVTMAEVYLGTHASVAGSDEDISLDEDDMVRIGRVMAASNKLLSALEELLAVTPARAPAADMIVGIEDRHRLAIAASRAAIRSAKGQPA